MRGLLVFFVIFHVSLTVSARGGRSQGSKLYVGGGFSQSELSIKSDSASSDFRGSGFTLGAGYDHTFSEYFGVQIQGNYSESRVINDSRSSISDDARLFTKNLGAGFIFGYFSVGAGTALTDIKIIPVSSTGLKYKYSPSMTYYYANLQFDYNEVLRTQFGIRLATGKKDQLDFSELGILLNLYFIIPGI